MVVPDRYNSRLANPVAPGCGFHSWLMGTANLGIMAGKDPHVLHEDIRRVVLPGTRRVHDNEIRDAIEKAIREHGSGTCKLRPRPDSIVRNGKAARLKIINQGNIISEADLWDISPVPLLGEPLNDPAMLISTLFRPDDLVWIGDRHTAGIMGNTIRTTADWIDHFRHGGPTAPHFIINPLTGSPAPKKSGDGDTLRGDGCVVSFRYCLVEFDDLSREDQLRFWSAVKLPIVALIDSGGKSIHALLEVSRMAKVTTIDEWTAEIGGRLYKRLLTPLGVDGACSNPARLSRLPGHYREEKQAWQRILWLSPEGRPINESI